MTLTTIHVREVIALTEEEVSQLPPEHTIVFDDNDTLETCRNETIYSYLFWDLFRPYTQTRILKKHHVGNILKGDSLDSGTHLKLCSRILQSVVEDEHLWLQEQKEPLLAAIYRTISSAMSKLSMITEPCVTSIDILDFIQIAKHPRIDALRLEAYNDPQNKIKYVYEETIRLIKTLPEFYDNGLAKAVRAKMVKENQVNQCVTFRGYPTEVDGAIYKKPNWGSYTLGNTSLYNFVSDSRTAAKSHYYSDTALKDSEYMARKFQLFASTVEKIVFEDCGTTKHLTWRLRGPEYDDAGTTIYPGDLPMLVGKYYLVDGEPDYKCIEGNEKHLYGKKIKIRSVLYCKTKNPHHICYKCAGKLSENISRFANIGHLSSATTTKPITQSVLSIKHVNTSSSSVKIRLKDHERTFMNTGVDSSSFKLNDNLKGLKPKLVVARDEALGLVDLENITDIEHLSLTRISRLTTVSLVTLSNNREISVNLDVTQKSKPSMMSRELLMFLKNQSWKSDERGNFIFDMSSWNYAWPLFVMPNNEESFVDLAKAVDTMVGGNQEMLEKRLMPNAPAILLQELFETVNSKLKINIFPLEVVVYALMVESSTSYAMARNSDNAVLGLRDNVISYHSLGAALAYESQNKILTDPINFFQGRRPDNPMDVFLSPADVVKQYPGL